MTKSKTLVTLVFLTTIFGPARARADCSTLSPCLSVSNTYPPGRSSAIYAYGSGDNSAIQAVAAGGGAGILSTSEGSGPAVNAEGGSGTGVLGGSTSGIGVIGSSYSNAGIKGTSNYSNAIVGVNNDTTGSAAAISAIAGSSSGLAYWGTGSIIVTGGAYKPGGGAWSAYSDERVKKDINDFRMGLKELVRVRPVTYRYNGLGGLKDDGKQYVGVVAQELEKILPTMVTVKAEKLHTGDAAATELKVVDPSAFTYLLINAVKEQQGLIAAQELRIASLEKRLAPITSSGPRTGGLGLGLMLGFVPMGLIVAARRRRRDDTRG